MDSGLGVVAETLSEHYASATGHGGRTTDSGRVIVTLDPREGTLTVYDEGTETSVRVSPYPGTKGAYYLTHIRKTAEGQNEGNEGGFQKAAQVVAAIVHSTKEITDLVKELIP